MICALISTEALSHIVLLFLLLPAAAAFVEPNAFFGDYTIKLCPFTEPETVESTSLLQVEMIIHLLLSL